MRGKLVVLIAFCAFLIGCDRNGAPSAKQVEAALNEAIKAVNPDAVVKLNSLKASGPFYMEFTFTCTNCIAEHPGSSRITGSSNDGHGMVTLDAKLQRWKFDSIYVKYGREYKSDHIF